jgi:carbonic anhydrase
LVLHTDLNCQSVLQFAINVLKVEHIIICGHYECGGVKASMSSPTGEILDNWLKKIRDVYFEHRVELNLMNDPAKRADRLVELNVTHQVRSVGHTVSAQNAWKEGRKLSIHGFVYNIREGKLIDLECSISGPEQITSIYRVHKES